MPRKKAPPSRPNIYEVVRRNVRMLMAFEAITGEQLAERMGFRSSQSLYERLNSGATKWSVEDLMKLSEIFDVDPAYLLEEHRPGRKPGANRIISGKYGESVVDSDYPGRSRRTAA